MTLNDEISKELSGHPDILAINIYRFNTLEIGIDDEIDTDMLALKIAEEIKSRYTFYKVALPGNEKANVFMLEANFANINEVTILAPEDLLPTEMVQTQIQIQALLEEEGFARKEEDEIEEFGAESVAVKAEAGEVVATGVATEVATGVVSEELQDASPALVQDLEEIESIFKKELNEAITIPGTQDVCACEN